jgi:hypothetical protein
MSCERRDQDLLLLTHGELSGLRRPLLEAHLRRCPRCQEQRDRYAVASAAMAGVLRGDALPPWQSRAERPPVVLSDSLRWAIVAAVVLLMGTATAAAVVWLPELAPERRAAPIHAGTFTSDTSCGSCHANLPANHPK